MNDTFMGLVFIALPLPTVHDRYCRVYGLVFILIEDHTDNFFILKEDCPPNFASRKKNRWDRHLSGLADPYQDEKKIVWMFTHQFEKIEVVKALY